MTSVEAEAAARAEMGEVSRYLFRSGPQFDFFQAVWLLENFFAEAPTPGEHADASEERILIRPYEADVFPPGDVKRIEWTDQEIARVTVTFMGLYGVDAPLPAYFHKNIAVRDEEARALRDFLDIFNHRLYAYFYRAWKKYRAHLAFDKSYRNPHAQRFVSLAGVGTAGALSTAPVSALRLSAFAGRLGSRTRNTEGLQAVLSGLLDDISVRIDENIPRWVPIRGRMKLGSNGDSASALGIDTVIGERLFDVSGKFRVVLGPMTFEQYRALLPGNAKARMVDWLVRTYAPDFLDFDVELLLKTEDVPPLKLGTPGVHLGVNTWIGRPTDEVMSDVVSYQ